MDKSDVLKKLGEKGFLGQKLQAQQPQPLPTAQPQPQGFVPRQNIQGAQTVQQMMAAVRPQKPTKQIEQSERRAKMHGLSSALGALGGVLSGAQGGPVQPQDNSMMMHYLGQSQQLQQQHEQEQQAHDLMLVQQAIREVNERQRLDREKEMFDHQQQTRAETEAANYQPRLQFEKDRAKEERKTITHRTDQNIRGWREQARTQGSTPGSAAGSRQDQGRQAESVFDIRDPNTHDVVASLTQEQFDRGVSMLTARIKEAGSNPRHKHYQQFAEHSRPRQAVVDKIRDNKPLTGADKAFIMQNYSHLFPDITQSIAPQEAARQHFTPQGINQNLWQGYGAAYQSMPRQSTQQTQQNRQQMMGAAVDSLIARRPDITRQEAEQLIREYATEDDINELLGPRQ